LVVGGVLCAFIAGGEAHGAPVDSGTIFLYNRQYEQAARYYGHAIAADPGSIGNHRFYQDACFGMGDTARQRVAEHYRSLASSDSTSAMYRYLYGRCIPCSLGLAQFDAALRLRPCCVWALNGRGACFFEMGDLAQAKEEFLKAIRCDETFGEAYQNLAAAYVQSGQYRKAQKVFRKLIGQGRTNPQSYEWLGDMYLARKEYEFARLSYEKAVRYGANSPAVFFKTGYAYFELGAHRKAAAYYTKSVSAGNRTFDVYYNLASALEQGELYDEAIGQYEEAFRRKSDRAILYSIGNCAVMLGLHSKAISAYERFLEEEPRNTEALFGLANAYQMRKDYERAVEIYEKILAIDSTFAKAYYNLGSIYAYHTKDAAKMQHYWGEFVQRFPRHEDADFIKNEMNKHAHVQ
jgi:tetratricopeptide (TPR) repeat protein